jgi:hypothetical protein
MKKIALPILVICLTMLACSITPTSEPPVTEPPVIEPPVTEPPVTEPPATEPPLVTNVICNELALYLDPSLASGYECETIPESPYEMELFPEHTKLTLTGYPLSGKFFEPHISIYPVAAYTALNPAAVPGRVAELQALIAGGSLPPFVASFSTSLPFLPTFNAGQAFYAQEQILPFASGRGIRFLTEFAQYLVPVNNNDLFYTYQALTSDGLYWVSAILPVNLPMLPADALNPPGGVTWEEFSNTYESYINDMVGQLNTQPGGNYIPSLLLLDGLVNSITITP